jgi:hypothetical protein
LQPVPSHSWFSGTASRRNDPYECLPSCTGWLCT